MTITNLPNLLDKPYGSSYSIWDERLCEYRDRTVQTFEFPKNNTRFKHHYFDLFKAWMLSSHPKIQGLDQFQRPCYTNGTSDAFAHFHLKYASSHRLRLRQGEYFFHQWVGRERYRQPLVWIDDEPLAQGDVVVLSVPFAGDGMCPVDLETILTQCDERQIPVLIDFAYLNLTTDLSIDLTHPCIEYVVSSLSKVFPVESWRIGCRWQRDETEDPLTIINQDDYEYLNFQSMSLGVAMMTEFEADWVWDQYRLLQLMECEALSLRPSDCVTFGLDDQNRYPEYSRGGDVNRLCFSRLWDGRKQRSENDQPRIND